MGHILLTKLKIKNRQNEFNSLALAPVSVLPEYQRNGIGGILIKEAHKKRGQRSPPKNKKKIFFATELVLNGLHMLVGPNLYLYNK